MAKFNVGQYAEYAGAILQILAVDEIGQTYTFRYITNPYDPPMVGRTITTGFLNIDLWFQPTSYTPPNGGGIDLAIMDWLPMPPGAGPPLPQGWHIYWPWYKGIKGPPWVQT